MMINIATVLFCTGIILFFRRIDRANVRIMKLKRFADKTLSDFKETSANENRRYSDATIEMDILLKKANSVSDSIRGSVAEIESKLKTIDGEKGNLAKLEHDLRAVTEAAGELNGQLKYIESVRTGFTDLTKKAAQLSSAIVQAEKDQSAMISSLNERVRLRADQITSEMRDYMEKSAAETGDAVLDTVRERANSLERTISSLESRIDDSEEKITRSLDAKITTLADSIRSLDEDLMAIKDNAAQEIRSELDAIAEKTDSMKNSFSSLESGLFAEVRSKTDSLKEEIRKATDDFNATRIAMIEKSEADITRVSDKLRSVEESITDSRSRLISSFEEEQNKIRNTMDELSIHAIAKKDEIIKAARREADEIRHKIETFDERYADVQKSLTRAAETKTAEFTAQFTNLEKKFTALVEKMENSEDVMASAVDTHLDRARSEFSRLEDRLSGIKQEISSYEDTNRIFSRADEMSRKVDDAIKHYSDIVEESNQRAKTLEEFFDGIDEFREAKKQLDKEMKIYQAKRDSIAGVESEIQGILALADLAKNKTDMLEMSASKIDQVENRISALSDAYSGLDRRITELHEYEAMIAQNLDNINKIDVLVNTFEARINTFDKSIGGTEKKLSSLKQYLAKIEEQTITLKSRENEIMNVMDKFHELDSLSEHLDERIKQISAMMGRVESVRSEVERSDTQLQSVAAEANKKIKQLTDIVQSVPSESGGHTITKTMKGNANITKGVNEAMMKMVRDLANKGWTSSDISKSMMLEENTVRLIINTSL
jgi:chromosome segregation ATPase